MKALKRVFILSLSLLSVNVVMSQVESGPLAISREYNPTSWGANYLPKDSGLKLSKEFGGISFTGRYASYTNADTWYLTYGSDGAMYSSYTDGSVNGQTGWSPNPRCAKVVGYDPLDLRVSVVGESLVHNGENGPGGKFKFGRYPAAQLIYNDVWYYGTYLLEWDDYSLDIANHDWQVLQPFIGFRVSDDFGNSWYDKTEPNRPILENAHDKWVNDFGVEFNPYEVMIGAPHFVDFGENLEYAPTDEATNRKWAYMVAHGADAGSTLAHNTWVSGDNVYLLRILMPEGVDVKENFNYMNDPANWQYLAKDGSYKSWDRDNLQEVYANIKPLVDATGYLGNVGLTYNAPLGKYIMTLSRMGLRDYFDTLILEADEIDGDYRVVQYMKGFATASYFMNIPSRFISDDGKTMWLCYSSNYNCDNAPIPNIGGSSYALCLTEFTLDSTKEVAAGKYEAEGMRRLGGAKINVEKGNSNDTSMGGIIRIGDGVEFHSKSEGNALAVVASVGCAAKQMSVYVNDKYRGKVMLSQPRNVADIALNYLPVKVHYGDKVRLSLEVADMEFNRYDVEQRDRAINIDYVVVDNIIPCQRQSDAAGIYAVTADKSGEQTLLVRYESLNKAGASQMKVEVNGHEFNVTPPALKRDGTAWTKALRIGLQGGENIIKITPEGGVEVLDLSLSNHHFEVAAGVKLKPQDDGSIDACDMLLNGLVPMTVHSGYTGKGFVAGLVALNKEAWLGCVPEVESGDYTLTIRYSAGEVRNTTLHDKRLLQLIVGDKVTVVEFPLTDGWKQWREVTIPIHIDKGDMITLKAHRKKNTDDCINVDKFVLK